MRTHRLLAAAATTLAGIALLSGPVAAGGPEFQDPSQQPPPPPPPTMTVSDATAYEADGSIAFDVELSQPAPEGMVISHSITHEDTGAADFVLVLSDGIAPGDTEYTIHLGLAGDDGIEDVENFVLNTSNNVGYQVANSAADGFIFDGGGPQMEIVDASAPEGDPGDDNHIDVVVQASYAPLEDITFRLYSGTFGFEALPGDDYEHIDLVVTLPAGETSVSTPLPIVEDLLDEPTELLPVYTGDESAGNFGLDGGNGIMRILDDDDAGDDAGDEGPGLEGPGLEGPGLEGPGHEGPAPAGVNDSDGATAGASPTTSTADAEVLAASAGLAGDRTGDRTGDLVRTGDELSIWWIVGALAVAAGAFLLILAAARRSRRPAGDHQA